MVSFMAVSLREVFQRVDPSERTTDLQLITLACTQISNWSLLAETYPITLSEQQANDLYDLGVQHLGVEFVCSIIFEVPKMG